MDIYPIDESKVEAKFDKGVLKVTSRTGCGLVGLATREAGIGLPVPRICGRMDGA